MAVKSLAIKYRPTTFGAVVEQSSTITILQQQLASGETKNAYLFCGGAGTGKTTCARIFANEINKFMGNPIEMDAASNSSVEDVRDIIQQAKTKSLDSEYKVFIIDECHSLSNTAWQALLKLLEEPPAKSIFIFCTTDPQKIPKTILSRVQRYDFQRISHSGIVSRLQQIIIMEDNEIFSSGGPADAIGGGTDDEALNYIAKIADGGMRDAITLLDKCLSFNTTLTLENVVKALGTAEFADMFDLTMALCTKESASAISIIESVHMAGKDLKQFVKSYMGFVLDLCKYSITLDFEYIEIPAIYKDRLDGFSKSFADELRTILTMFVKLNADIKWETFPKPIIESAIIIHCN